MWALPEGVESTQILTPAKLFFWDRIASYHFCFLDRIASYNFVFWGGLPILILIERTSS
jgi:hypothetical protein